MPLGSIKVFTENCLIYGTDKDKKKIEEAFRTGTLSGVGLELFFIMKGIWQKYKIWLLIGVFYSAYWVVKGFKMLKRIDIHRIKLSADGSNLKCG